MLMRMRELAVQASNDSLTSQDREFIQLEINELREQINRIANTTQFNNKRILDGSSGAMWSSSDLSLKATINKGLITVDEFGQKVNHEGNYKIQIEADPGQGQVQKSSIMTIYKTETEDSKPEEITETVRTIKTTQNTRTEMQLIETVTTRREPYRIYINGKNANDMTPVDNAVEIPDIVNEDEVNEIRSKWHYDARTDSLRITDNGTFNIVGRLDGDGNTITTNTRILVEPGLVDVNLFITDVDITSYTGPAMDVSGSHVNLYVAGKNTLKSSYSEAAGIECQNIKSTGQDCSLTISSASGDESENGTLLAEGYFCGAGIGEPCHFYNSSTWKGSVGNITINGGTITAKADPDWDGAGIGGGGCGNDMGTSPKINITINGGNITAIGGKARMERRKGGAGIGSGGSSLYSDDVVESITINGGTINAQGSTQGAGIGGGQGSNSGNIRISSNANVTVSGWIDTASGNTQAIGLGLGGMIGANDSVTFTNDPPEVRYVMPVGLNVVEQSTIYEPVADEIITEEKIFGESTRTVTVSPSPSMANELKNLTENESAGVNELTANGLPAGTYTVKTASAANNNTLVNFTGSYGFNSDLSSLINLEAGNSSGLSTLLNNASILFEVTDVDTSSGKVTLKATANLLSTDGKISKHIVRENIILTEGNSTALSGLDIMGDGVDYDTEERYPAAKLTLSSGAAKSFSTGNKFVYNLTVAANSSDSQTIEISRTQDSQPVKYGISASAVTNSALEFSNFYLSGTDGTVYEGA